MPAEDDEPDGDVQHAQTHHSETHDRAGGEGHPQALVQTLAGGLSGAGVGAGGNFHAHEAGQHGPDTSGEKGEGGELGEHLSPGGKGHHQQDEEDHQKDLRHSGVLVLQIGVGPLPNGGGDLGHFVTAFGEGHDPAALEPGKRNGNGRAHETDPEQIVHHSTHSFALGKRAPARAEALPCNRCYGHIVPY